ASSRCGYGASPAPCPRRWWTDDRTCDPEAAAHVVHARVLACAPCGAPPERRPVPVDDGEQARLGCAPPDDDRSEVGPRARRHPRLPRGRAEPRGAGDERLGGGPPRLVVEPRGAPGRGDATAPPGPETGPGAGRHRRGA